MARIKRVPVADVTRDENACTSTADAESIETAEPGAATVKRKRRRRGRTNSERARAFRKRQDQGIERLEREVVVLRTAVQEKQFLLGVWEAKYLRTRHSLHGSLVAVVREYHALFRHGIARRGPTEAFERQVGFVHSAMDPDVASGSHVRGVQAIIDQWRLHTAAFERYSGLVVGVPQVFGVDECPVVKVQIQVDAVIGDKTLEGLFPPAARKAARRLLQPFMNRPVQFVCRSAFQFTRANQISVLLVQIDYIEGFQAAGMRLRDAAELLTLSALTPASTIVPTCP